MLILAVTSWQCFLKQAIEILAILPNLVNPSWKSESSIVNDIFKFDFTHGSLDQKEVLMASHNERKIKYKNYERKFLFAIKLLH